MITSALSLPACSACGSREVHVVHRPPLPEKKIAQEALFPYPLGRQPLHTFFACRGCGRDVTDAWAPLQPERVQ